MKYKDLIVGFGFFYDFPARLVANLYHYFYDMVLRFELCLAVYWDCL